MLVRSLVAIGLIGAAPVVRSAAALPASEPPAVPSIVYVGMTNDTVVPIDTTAGTAGDPIAVGGDPRAIAVTPDGATAYVIGAGTDVVTPIDTRSETAEPDIDVVFDPTAIAVAPNGETAYVVAIDRAGDRDYGQLVPIDVATNSRTVPPIPVGADPSAIAITPDGKTAYIVDGGNAYPVDLASLTVGNPIPMGAPVCAIAMAPDGATAYVTTCGSRPHTRTVLPLDVATNTVGTPIRIGRDPVSIAINSDGTSAYVTLFHFAAARPLDLVTGAAGHVVELGNPRALTIVPDGGTVYVVTQNTVTPIDTATNQAGAPIPMPAFGLGIAATPDEAPTAMFTVSAAGSGSPTTFDAATSVAPSTPIVRYRWKFGDGTAKTTTTPTTTHTYAAPGDYSIVLTVTDAAGTSTRRAFTGQTMSRNGSSAAQATRTIVIH